MGRVPTPPSAPHLVVPPCARGTGFSFSWLFKPRSELKAIGGCHTDAQIVSHHSARTLPGFQSLVVHPQVANDNDAMHPGSLGAGRSRDCGREHACGQLVHRDFQNEIAKFGDVVHTRRPGTFKIKRTDHSNTLAKRANATNVRVPLDQWLYNSFTITDRDSVAEVIMELSSRIGGGLQS